MACLLATIDCGMEELSTTHCWFLNRNYGACTCSSGIPSAYNVDNLVILLCSEDPQKKIDNLTYHHRFFLKGTGPIHYHFGCDNYFRDHDKMLWTKDAIMIRWFDTSGFSLNININLVFIHHPLKRRPSRCFLE
jgi:hypothetical protein